MGPARYTSCAMLLDQPTFSLVKVNSIYHHPRRALLQYHHTTPIKGSSLLVLLFQVLLRI